MLHSHGCEQIPDKEKLTDLSLVLAHGPGDMVHHEGKGVAAGAVYSYGSVTVAGHITVTIKKQRKECWCFAPFPLFIQSMKVSHRMVSLTFRVALNPL